MQCRAACVTGQFGYWLDLAVVRTRDGSTHAHAGQWGLLVSTVAAKRAKDVVVAGRGMVVENDGGQVGADISTRGEVSAAALALAVAESRSSNSAVRIVLGNRAVGECEHRGLVVEEAATQAVAAVASASV